MSTHIPLESLPDEIRVAFEWNPRGIRVARKDELRNHSAYTKALKGVIFYPWNSICRLIEDMLLNHHVEKLVADFRSGIQFAHLQGCLLVASGSLDSGEICII